MSIRALAAVLALVATPACGGGTSSSDATCTGSCRDTQIDATFAAGSGDFTVAYFGLTAPGVADSGDWEIYVEVSAGGDGQCPTESSPTPDRLFIVSGLPVPADDAATTAGTVTVVDFSGDLLPDAVKTEATSHTASAPAAQPCLECTEGGTPDGDRFVAYDVSAEFPEGVVSGHLFATHCDSLDSLMN